MRIARSLLEAAWDYTTLVYQANMDSELRDDRSPAYHRKAMQDYGLCSTLGSTEAYDRLDHLFTPQHRNIGCIKKRSSEDHVSRVTGARTTSELCWQEQESR
jgi:hypothetical protein